MKSFGLVGMIALSFTLMSFSSSGNDLYGTSNTVVNTTSNKSQEISDEAWVVAAVRFTAAATRRAVVYTAEVTRVALPQVEQAIIQASTVVIANQVDEHIDNYVSNKETIQNQRLRKLG